MYIGFDMDLLDMFVKDLESLGIKTEVFKREDFVSLFKDYCYHNSHGRLRGREIFFKKLLADIEDNKRRASSDDDALQVEIGNTLKRIDELMEL